MSEATAASSTSAPRARGLVSTVSATRSTPWLVGAALIFAEAATSTLAATRSSARLFVFAIGLLVPWVVAGAGLSSAALAGVRHLYRRLEVRIHWEARASCAVFTSVLLASAPTAVGTVLVSTSLVRSIKTPELAAMAVLASAGFAIVLTILFAFAAYPVVERGLDRVALAAPRLAPALRPATPLAIVMAAAAFVGYAWLSRRPALVAAVPWERLAVDVGAVLLAILLASQARGRSAWGRATHAASFALGGALLVVFVAASVAWSSPAERALLPRSSLARVLLSLDDALLDFDRDGAPSLYAGADCAPLDSARSPLRLEIPDNGTDEDCSGRDVKSDLLPVNRGARRHRPNLAAEIPKRPHIILVTTDALSFEHTGVGGYTRDVTPALDAWATRATVFEQAFSTSSSTANAIPALLSGVFTLEAPGLLPPRNQPHANAPPAPTLAVHARAAGYRTVAIPGASYFTMEEWPSLMGTFDEVDTVPIASAVRSAQAKPYAGPHLVDAALQALDDAHGEPLFLWLHFFDHHPTYDSPPGGAKFGVGSELDRYDSELAFADAQWGRLFSGIEARFTPDEYIIVFTSDHGEAFDEDHTQGHHDQGLGRAEARVPFIVQTAYQRGQRPGGLVSHLDLVPTLLDVLDMEGEFGARGESLLRSLVLGEPTEKTFTVSLLWHPQGGPLGSPPLRVAALRWSDGVYIDDRERGTTGLFREAKDELAHSDLSSSEPEVAEWARYTLRKELAAAGYR
ncbi:MAG: sulfatase [Polyangiaceae bacterium]